VLGVSPASLAFGSRVVGIPSAAQAVTISNTGTAALSITSISVTGSATHFVLTNGCGATLAAGATCTASVAFRPASVGVKTANLTVTVGAPASTRSVSLTGSGVAPVLAVNPASVAFASQVVGTTSAARVVTISNAGTGPMSITSVALTGSASQFVLTSDCGATLAAGASCGAKTANLAVTVAAPAVSLNVPLTGSGIAPVLTVSPTSIAFGNQAVGVTSAAQSVTISNTGTSPMAITSVALTGSASQFVMTHNCGAGLAVGASCTASVSIRPTSIGNKTANLAVTVVAPAVSRSVALTGTGI